MSGRPSAPAGGRPGGDAASRAARAALPEAVLPFVSVVVRQVAHPLGLPDDQPERARAREESVRGQLEAVLRLAVELPHGPSELDTGAARLARDPVLLSACFQNTDLLPANGGPAADRVALLVLRALELLAATPPD